MTDTRAARLRKAIDTGLARIMAAHSPLSATLVEEAGFDGIWASGFELSALLGLPDVSLVTMTQHLEMLRAMAQRVDLPIVADIDTGFGNAVNVVHAVRLYEEAGATAVVIEDKSFPKVTSLVAEGRQELVRSAEFQGKIAAAIATRRDPGFLVIARTEALIAGLGQDEALARARDYAAAGADLVLVHSKSRSPDEIEAFARAWNGRCGLVLVPTAYPQLDEQRIRALGVVRMVIYGNHAIRAAVTAMRSVFARIAAEGGIAGVDRDIVTVEEIFRLQRMDAVKETERRFLR
jgi:phosphoenolpyruvate phosphomutase